MEDFIAYLLIASLIFIVCLTTYSIVKLIKNHRQRSKEASKKLWENMQDTSKVQREIEMARAQARASRLNLAKPTPAKLNASKSYASTPSSSSTTTSTTSSSNDSLLSDLATMYVLNAALNHGSAKASVDYDTNSVKIETPRSSSSWGLDDDDSRRSSSSSFGSSDSSSSWDSSSSSSDSGPSSDW